MFSSPLRPQSQVAEWLCMPYKAATKPRPATTRAPARPAATAGVFVAPAAMFFLAVAVAVADDAVVVVVFVVFVAVLVGVLFGVAVAVTEALVTLVTAQVPPVKTGFSLTTSANGGNASAKADTNATGAAVRDLNTELPTLDTQLCACGGKVAAQLGTVPAAYKQKALLVVRQAAMLSSPEGKREEMLGGGVGKMVSLVGKLRSAAMRAWI